MESAGSAHRLTLHLHDATAEQIFAEISERTHLKFTGSAAAWAERRWPKVEYDFDLDDQPFWSAIRRAFMLTRTQPQIGSMAPRLIPTTAATLQGDLNTPPSASPPLPEGAWPLVSVSLHRVSTVNVDNPQNGDESLQLSAMLLYEPTVLVVGRESVRLTEVLDMAGHAMPLPEQLAAQPIYDDLPYNQIVLKLPVTPANDTKLARIRGVIQLNIEKKLDIVDIEHVALGPTRADVTLGPVNFNLSGGKASYAVRFDVPGHAAASSPLGARFRAAGWRAALRDSAGHDYSLTRPASDGDAIVLTFTRPAGAGDPETLHLEIPAATETIDVPFELRDLKIP